MSQDSNQHTQQEDSLSKVGQMTRLLHDNLRGLGLDKLLEKAAEDIPDARDRLDYVARMSEQAAQRVLNATDIAIPLQEQLDEEAKKISVTLEALLLHSASPEQYQAASKDVLQYLSVVSSRSAETKAHLKDIMMAQDCQDLTGQVIKKVTSLDHNLERQLVQLLIDFSPAATPKKEVEVSAALMNGPQIDPSAVDVVASQEQVDDLLDSLGF